MDWGLDGKVDRQRDTQPMVERAKLMSGEEERKESILKDKKKKFIDKKRHRFSVTKFTENAKNEHSLNSVTFPLLQRDRNFCRYATNANEKFTRSHIKTR